MATHSLRELAREHARGNLDKNAYRKARAELLQGIVAETIAVEENDYPPLVQPPEPESLDDTLRRDEHKKVSAKQAAARPEPASTPTADAPRASEGKSHKSLLAGLLVVVVVTITGIVILVGGDDADTTRVTPAVSASDTVDTTATVPTPTASRAVGLLQDFLDAQNWSATNLENFLQQWQTLPEDETVAGRTSLEMGQLTNAIYKQLLEERALSGLVDDDSSVSKQRQLVQFARQLGIDDERLSVAEEMDAMEE